MSYRFAGDVSTLLWQQNLTGETDGLFSGGVTRAGQLFQTGHILIGKTPTKIIFSLKKTESPSGNAELKLIDSSSVEKATFGTIVVSSLTTSFVSHEFELQSSPATIADGDRIAWYYSGDKYFYFENCGSCSESYTNNSYWGISSAWVNRTISCTMQVYGY